MVFSSRVVAAKFCNYLSFEQDDGGYTPLIWAAEHEQLEVVKYLLKRNADPNLRDSVSLSEEQIRYLIIFDDN